MAKTVRLTRGKFAVVDDADYSALVAHKWYANRRRARSRTWYAFRKGPDGETISMHRAIMGMTDPSVDIDHRSGDGLDNRRANLRAVPKDQHTAHHAALRKATTVTTSRFVGVYCDSSQRRSKPWRARIRVAGKKISLGWYHTEDQAASAVRAAR